MSTCDKIEKWLRTMNYGGKIPNDLRKICNPSTVHIWEQLISKIKPRDEVDHIRKNIIINRLQQKSLENQDEFAFPIKEIEVYTEKLALEKRLGKLDNKNDERENVIDQISLGNNQLYIKISHTKERINEHKQKKFLLENKIRLLENDVKRAKEVFSRNTVSDKSTVTQKEILNKCVEKIRKRIEEVYNQDDHENVTKCLPKSTRESLGVLPDDLWNTSDEFDKFLSFNTSTFLESKSLSSINSASNMDKEVDWFIELCNEEYTKKTIENLLKTNSIEAVRASWDKIYQKLVSDFLNMFQNQPHFKSPEVNFNELYLFHIKTELEQEKLKHNLHVLKSQIAERKNEILVGPLFSDDVSGERKALFNLQLEEIGLKAANNFLCKTATASSVIEDKELSMIQEKINKIKEDIDKKIALNKTITEKIYKTFRYIENVEHEKSVEIRRFNSDLFDPNVLNNIKEEVISKEIKLFWEFPTTFKQNDGFSTIVPSYVNLNDENVNKIARIIDVPYSPEERIILNALELKIRKLDLEALEFKSPVQYLKQYNKTDFDRKDEYVEQTVSTLMKTNNSALVQEILKLCEYIKEGKRLKETKPWECFLQK